MEGRQRNVMVIVTGGTWMMEEGHINNDVNISRVLREHSRFHDKKFSEFTTMPFRGGARIHYDILQWDEMIDSSEMNMEHWRMLCHNIEDNYNDYIGFVIIHGTDTMAYTASALSFMMDNLSKPVILTGSQIPLGKIPNDAEGNFIGALMIAGHYQVPEVCIYFNNHLYRGNRCTKLSSTKLDAYDTPNYPPLCKVGIDYELNWKCIRDIPRKDNHFRITYEMSDKVVVLKLFPGISKHVIKNVLQPPTLGCVLESFGSGNAPKTEDFLEIIKEATDRGVLILNVTQCSHGDVIDGLYAAGSALLDAGVIGGQDLTSEGALTKLSWVIGKNLPNEESRRLLLRNIKGELTPRMSQNKYSLSEERYLREIVTSIESEDHSISEFVNAKTSLFPLFLCSAASQNNVENISSLLTSGADINSTDYHQRTALHEAVAANAVDAVDYLLKQGANMFSEDLHGVRPVDEVLKKGNEEIIELFRRRGAINRPKL